MAVRWYDSDGKIVENVIGKNGKERKVNIRDAKEHGYFPSVTSVLSILEKPALTKWFVDEAIKAAYNNKWALNKPEKEATKILAKIGREEGEKAAKFGTEIHNHIEMFLKAGEGEDIQVKGKVEEYVFPVFEYLDKEGIKGLSEKALIIEHNGKKAAGTTDNLDKDTIRDFKTQKTRNGKFTVYPSWLWQLGAYNIPSKKDKGEIIAISSTEPKLIKTFKFSKEQLEEGAKMFGLLLEVFYLMKGL